VKDFIIHLGRRVRIPPTVQIKHEIMRMVLDAPDRKPAPQVAIPTGIITP
jgi:hypothetical protein